MKKTDTLHIPKGVWTSMMSNWPAFHTLCGISVDIDHIAKGSKIRQLIIDGEKLPYQRPVCEDCIKEVKRQIMKQVLKK